MLTTIEQPMDLMRKLEILADAAKYDVACTSSGVDRKNDGTGIGNCVKAGICHSFSADGRCISLLKILLTNEDVYKRQGEKLYLQWLDEATAQARP